MSISPLLLGELLTNSMRMMLRSSMYPRPWITAIPHLETSGGVRVDKDKFRVEVDVQEFKPEEISVKLRSNEIIIEGKHEEKKDEEGFVSRHFVRRYLVPEGHDMEKIVSHLSSDGILSVTAPRKDVPAVEIPITKTGQPAVEDSKKTE